MNSVTPILKGNLFILSAPSGAGKTSLVNALVQSVKNLKISVSTTTRLKRPNEQNGVNYHFIDRASFESGIKADAFLEHAEVYGQFYGSSKAKVLKELQAGFDVILEIDWQGAKQIKSLFPDSKSVFVLPPSQDALMARLRNRDQDQPEVIAQRMLEAKAQISHYLSYDYLVCNDRFEEALEDLKTIVRAHALVTNRQALRFSGLLNKLLS